jgi:hypothetical protein
MIDMNGTSMKRQSIGILAGIVVACAALPAGATEQIFPETYLSETLPKGALEFENWTTYREGKSQGTYALWQNRTEIEYGITDRWLASIYFNSYSVKAHNDNSAASRRDFTSAGGDGDEVSGGGPGTFGQYVPNSTKFPIPAANYHKTNFDSVSLEQIYSILSPYSDGIGLSAYLEYTYGSDIQEIEMKALVQKNLMDDRLILAGNLVVELEKNSYNLISTEKETELELTGGASYRFAQHWRVGIEGRNIQGFGGYSLGSSNHTYAIWYAGPMVSYSNRRFFAVLGYQRQLPWAEAFQHAAQLETVSGLNYYEYEKNFLRLKFGLSFR